GLQPITARDANAMNLAQVLRHEVREPVPQSAIPTSDQVPGPTGEAATVCSAASVQSVSPAPVPGDKDNNDADESRFRVPPRGGYPTQLGMGALARKYRRAPLLK